MTRKKTTWKSAVKANTVK